MSQGIVSSRTVSIGELLRSGSFEPANLQREYCWGEPQQTDLMEDLVAQFGRFGFDPEPETAIPDKAGGASADPAFELAARSPELEKGAPYCLFGNVDLFPEGPVFEIYDDITGLLAELREQYVLGYYPRDLRGDGSWRPVEVHVDTPGVRLRYRNGWVDRP